MENCNLPNELLVDILTRLPVKSLMRFKCVCKLFYDLIKNDHQFMHKFYVLNKAANEYAVIGFEGGRCLPSHYIFGLIPKEMDSDEIGCTYIDIPDLEIIFVGCCEGMFCLILNDGRGWPGVDMGFDFLIWNPYTREIKQLPSTVGPSEHSLLSDIFDYELDQKNGFGISNNMTWKVVMLWSFEPGIDISHNRLAMVCSQIGDGSWIWRQIYGTPNFLHCFDEDFYLKGKYYWRVLTMDTKDCLLWFDFDNEVFGTIEFPLGSFKAHGTTVTIMNDTVALLIDYSDGNKKILEVWLMSESGDIIDWNKHVSMEFGGRMSRDERWMPIGVWNQGGHYHLLVHPYMFGELNLRQAENSSHPLPCQSKNGFTPYLISLDMETQEMKPIYFTQGKKSVQIDSTPRGYVQVYKDFDGNTKLEWNDFNFSSSYWSYARIHHTSLKMV
ncbi:unnamed protein product [Cuscuta europaea]|uniref:F-box domain-containing protein n=1 Tax=Cuscuta europaea TaxID=41803 RepID=A0A9P0ZSJ3_CUSEU|nr:unnamed protein product [Cuscuta europaea]